MAKSGHHHSSFLLSVLVKSLLLVAGFTTTWAEVPAVIIFGDSTVDTGNNNRIDTVLKSNFKPYGQDFEGGQSTGRFSNGRVASDFVSEIFGCKSTLPAYLDPNYNIADFTTGVVFASAGTGYDNSTAALLNVIPFWKEIEYYKEYQARLKKYLGKRKASETISEAMYVISIGTNDFLENFYINFMTRVKFKTANKFGDHLLSIAKKFMEELYALGVRKISHIGLPPMGCLPLERTLNIFNISQCNEEYNQAAVEFNGKLKVLVERINKEKHGIRMVYSNIYDTLMRMIRKPSQFGYKVTSSACCGTGRVEMSYICDFDRPLSCDDPNVYVFWDSFHPTEKTARIIVQHLFKTVLRKFI